MDDLISRQAAIDIFDDYNVSVENGELEAYCRDRKRLCELPTIQPEERTEKRTETHACDCVSRQAAIDALEKDRAKLEPMEMTFTVEDADLDKLNEILKDINVKECPWFDVHDKHGNKAKYYREPLSTEKYYREPISYQDCSNAMIKMWMDNVITDGEYNRIMEKLNSKYMTDMRGDSDE